MRSLFLHVEDQGGGDGQSLIQSASLTLTGSHFIVVGMVADLIAETQKLLEKVDRWVQNITPRDLPVRLIPSTFA